MTALPLPYNLTAHAGLSLVGQYLKRFAQIDQVIDPLLPVSAKGGIATGALIKAHVGLLRTVMQEIIGIAAFTVFERHYQILLQFAD